MEAEDEELADWLAGQGSYAASRLAGLPSRAAFRLRVEELTAATSGRPVPLRVDPHAGHGFGSTRAQRAELTADMFAFLTHELGRAGYL